LLFIHSLFLCPYKDNLKGDILSIPNYFLLHLKNLPLSRGGRGRVTILFIYG
jgi:hypothetical protein